MVPAVKFAAVVEVMTTFALSALLAEGPRLIEEGTLAIGVVPVTLPLRSGVVDRKTSRVTLPLAVLTPRLSMVRGSRTDSVPKN